MLQNSYNNAHYVQDIYWSIIQILFALALHTILKTSTLQEQHIRSKRQKRKSCCRQERWLGCTWQPDSERGRRKAPAQTSGLTLRNMPLRGPSSFHRVIRHVHTEGPKLPENSFFVHLTVFKKRKTLIHRFERFHGTWLQMGRQCVIIG